MYNSKEQSLPGLTLYKRLLQVAKRYWLWFVLGIIATIMVSGIDAAFTWFIKPLVNKGMVAKDQVFLQWLPIILIAGIFLRTMANLLSTYGISRVARSVVMVLRQRALDKLLKLPADYYDAHSSGHLLAAIIYNIDQVANASSQVLVTLFREAALLVGMLVVMCFLSWKLTAVVLVVSPVLYFIIRFFSRHMRRISHKVQDTIGEVTSVTKEAIDNYHVIRINALQKTETDKMTQVTKLNRNRELKMVVVNMVNNALIQLMVAVPIVLVIFYATNFEEQINAGGFIAMVVALFGVLRPLRQLSRLNNQIQKGIAGAASTFALLDEPEELDEGSQAIVSPVRGHIEFKNIEFKYATANYNALHDLSFEVQPGKKVALVGHSGAGKSTILQLLARFYQPQNGAIFLDGVDIQQYVLSDLRRQIAYVSQKTTLFNATIAENIAMGNSSASQEEIRRAAEAAYVLEFSEKLPKGLDTLVGQDGVLLSGGQRQRLAIARAIIKGAPILLLDEATSALDTASEKYIQLALKRLSEDKTVLVIAHRLSTIEQSDAIIVIDRGRVLETGTHSELLNRNGTYADLYQQQFGGDA